MRVCIAGKNQISVFGLRLALSKLQCQQVVVCPNSHDDGRSGWQPSLRRHALELGVSILSLEDAERDPDLIFISLEFDRIIHPSRFATDRLYNIHFSKLPAYKGVYTSAWPILNGERETGVTLHRIDEGIDTGGVIAQRSFNLADNETARSLYYKYLEEAALLLQDTFELLLSDEAIATPQPASGSTYYSKSSINYANLTLDLRQTACTLDRQIRAYSFREFQQPRIEDMPAARAIATMDRSTRRPGSVLQRNEDGLLIATIDYDAWIDRDRSLDLLSHTEAENHEAIQGNSDLSKYVDVSGRNGWTPLMIASYRGDMRCCEALLALGASANRANCNGTTALMYSKDFGERSGDFSVCELLLAHGADPYQLDAFGKSVVDYAKANWQPKALAFFLNHLS